MRLNCGGLVSFRWRALILRESWSWSFQKWLTLRLQVTKQPLWQERVGQLLQANARFLVSFWQISALEYFMWGTQVLPKETMNSKPWVPKQCAGNRIGPGRSLMCQSSSLLRRGLQKRSQLPKPQKLKSPSQRRPPNPRKQHLQCQSQEAGRPEQVVCHLDMELYKQIITAKALILCTWQYCEMPEENKEKHEIQPHTYNHLLVCPICIEDLINFHDCDSGKNMAIVHSC